MSHTGGQFGKMTDEVAVQRAYYARTAKEYDSAHIAEGDEHYFASAMLLGALEHLSATSVLEIGAGTGRSIDYLRSRRPNLRVIGVEPVRELREIAYKKGVDPTELVDGDVLDLQFETGSIDVVCAFAVLHHVREPERAVREMLRVARRGVFISDANNFGQGGVLARSAKQLLNAAGLWKFANWIKTSGKGYSISEGDGLFYSYSVFNNYELLKASCRSVHVMNSTRAGVNPYRTAPLVMVLGIK